MPKTTIRRKPCHHQPRDKAALTAAVKAAYLEMIGQGVYPSIERLRRRLKLASNLVENARRALIESGDVPMSESPFATWAEDDPFTEPPDDPDAADVRARIAAIRAEKEAQAVPEPIGVMRARDRRPRARTVMYA